MKPSPRRTEIAIARLSAGLLQKEAAARLNVSVSYFQKVELGKLPPSARIVAHFRPKN